MTQTNESPEYPGRFNLKNSGELALLTNPELRQSLATMDARLEIIKAAQADLVSVQQLNIDPYMINNFDLRSFYGTLTGLDDMTDESTVERRFTSDTQFRNLVLLKLDLVTELEKSFENVDTALIEVQQSIATQLATQLK